MINKVPEKAPKPQTLQKQEVTAAPEAVTQPQLIVRLADLLGRVVDGTQRAAKRYLADAGEHLHVSYPKSRIEPTKEEKFGVTIEDDYRWLEDGSSEEVCKWVADQDGVARAQLAALPEKEGVARRLSEIYRVKKVWTPVQRGDFLFYVKLEPEQEKPVLYVKNSKTGEERVLIDPNKLSDGKNISLGVWVPNQTGTKLAYSLRPNNSDEAIVYVMDVATGQVDRTDQIDGGRYAEPEWAPDGRGFYYTWIPTDPKIPSTDVVGYSEIRFHKLGTDSATDKTIVERSNDSTVYMFPSISYDGKWLFITKMKGRNSTDIYYVRTDKPGSEPTLFFKGNDTLAKVIHWKGYFYIFTSDGSPMWRVLRTPESKPESKYWESVVPERNDVLIEDAMIVGGHLLLQVLKNAAKTIEVRSLDGSFLRDMEVPGIGSAGDISGSPDGDEVFYSFASFTIPTRIYRSSISSGETRMWAEAKRPIDSTKYVVEQVWYPSKDGTKVSMFVVHSKEMQKDKSTPFLLWAYGSFAHKWTPQFYGYMYPWLEAGGGFAVLNVRGGGEYGEEWHRAGMTTKKQNTFDDFIAGAQYLVDTGYTGPDKLVINGESSGGIVVGAAITQRPDLFKVAVFEKPILDMVHFPEFGKGKAWLDEFGYPDDEDQFKALFAYSPYHHVQKGVKYPATLFLSADTDERVDPMHTRKMVAAMQAASTSGAPVLMRVQKNAGHSGAGQQSAAIDEDSDNMAFIMHYVGIKPPAERR